MRVCVKVTGFLYIVIALFNIAYAQSNHYPAVLSSDDLSAFKDPGNNWHISSDAIADYTKSSDMRLVKGAGVIVNRATSKDHSHLITTKEFGDLDVELDFMVSKNSNSGVFMQGRYEVQLTDSWGKSNPGYFDSGGLAQGWDESKASGNKGPEGVPPLMNTSKAPGLWQHLRIVFKAPTFNANGAKITNARFEQVYLNGVLVQAYVEITGPTPGGLFHDEKAMGPLVFQGDKGRVAFKNIKYQVPPGEKETKKTTSGSNYVVIPAGKPYLLRSFMAYGDKKLTHVISVGNPNQVNYSYDLSRGSLLQIWRGHFVDVTTMWSQRGKYQLARPMGSLIPFTNAPLVAVLPDQNTIWPDSIPFDEVKIKGYTLDKNRNPTFKYTISNVSVTDKITVPDATTLTREISILNPAPKLNLRIVSADKIQSVGKGLYVINDKSFYIKLDKKITPTIRQLETGQELLIPITKSSTVSYSIIW